MNIDLYNIDYFYLSTDSDTSNDENLLGQLLDSNIPIDNIHRISPDTNIDRQKREAMGHAMMVEAGRTLNNDTGFKPFIILENDVQLYNLDTIPKEMRVPLDSDLVYLGISLYASTKKEGGYDGDFESFNQMYCDPVDEEYVQVFNMLTSHAILFCSEKMVNAYVHGMRGAFAKNIGDNQLYITTVQPSLNCYALKRPFFYKRGMLDRNVSATKVQIRQQDKVLTFRPDNDVWGVELNIRPKTMIVYQ